MPYIVLEKELTFVHNNDNNILYRTKDWVHKDLHSSYAGVYIFKNHTSPRGNDIKITEENKIFEIKRQNFLKWFVSSVKKTTTKKVYKFFFFNEFLRK